MEKMNETLNQFLPWILLVILLVFTLVVVSNVYGIYKARKVDPSLRLALNKLGKILFVLLYGAYVILFIYTVVIEIQIFTMADVTGADRMILALNAPNALTVVTFLAGIEFQDIFFVGDKNVYVAGRMYETRRMRKVNFPKKHEITFVYGQKQYNYSTRFVDLTALKPKLKR